MKEIIKDFSKTIDDVFEKIIKEFIGMPIIFRIIAVTVIGCALIILLTVFFSMIIGYVFYRTLSIIGKVIYYYIKCRTK